MTARERAVLPGGITHVHHLRIAWVLHRRHGAEQAHRRLIAGTNAPARSTSDG